MKFELIPHTADLQIRVYGETEKELFCNALIGMFQSINPKSDKTNTKEVCHEIKLEATQTELLLVDFLSEALYLSCVNHEAYNDIDVHDFNLNYINATIKGIKIVGFDVEIKAVTYHNLSIQKELDYYTCDIVFDI